SGSGLPNRRLCLEDYLGAFRFYGVNKQLFIILSVNFSAQNIECSIWLIRSKNRKPHWTGNNVCQLETSRIRFLISEYNFKRKHFLKRVLEIAHPSKFHFQCKIFGTAARFKNDVST